MKFIPLETTGRAMCGCRCGYTILLQRGQNGRAGTFRLSIHPDLMRALKVQRDSIWRLDGDIKAGMARLTPVATLGKAARRIRVSATGRGDWSIPHSGLVAEAFPKVTSVTELAGVEVTSDGLLFEIPKKGDAS